MKQEFSKHWTLGNKEQILKKQEKNKQALQIFQHIILKEFPEEFPDIQF